MRVDCVSVAADAADAAEADKAVVLFNLDGADLGSSADIAWLATDIYRYAREGRRVVIAEAAPSLAAVCADIGLDVEEVDAWPASPASRADIFFLRNGGDLDGVEIVSPAPASETGLRVAIAGLGLIGEGAALRLGADNPAYSFCAALVREPFKDRAPLAVDQVTNDLAAFLATRPDVVIDALPDGAAGRRLIKAALERGVSIVSANKQALAGALGQLTALAEETGATLRYAASVGGGAPFIETTARAAKEAEILSIEAALNGTVNYILTSLAKGVAFDAAVKAAQRAGFAEPDPSADLSGDDARAKLSILSFIAFGEEIDPDAFDVEPLTAEKAARLASEGGVWKQIARLDRNASGALRASVRFERRDKDVLFAAALWEANALRLHLADGRRVECAGKGAGRAPTVESILGDLEDIRRAKARRPKIERTLAEDRVTA